MKTRRCMKCDISKPLKEYYKTNLEAYDYIDYYCKYCRVGTSIFSQHNKTKKCSIEECNNSHYAKSWCRKHYARWERTGSVETKMKMRQKDEAVVYGYNKQKRIYRRTYLLSYLYKMTMEEFIEKSKNGCQICGAVPEDRNLHVDHDHKCCNNKISCGKCVRGVVCSRCNVAIDKYEDGLMRADNQLIPAIKQYLEKYNVKKR